MMRTKRKNTLRICTIFACILALGFSGLPVLAEDSVEGLENKTSELQNELSGMNNELTTLSSELDTIASKIETTSSAVEQVKIDLADAKAKESTQYESTKTRIQYMYEEGNTTFLEMLFESDSMADFLNKADFISSISEYDRQMLDELREAQEVVEKKEAELNKEQDSLTTLQDSLAAKQTTLNQKISATSTDLSQYSAQLDRAKAAEAAAKAALEKQIVQQQQASSGNTNSGSTSRPPTTNNNPYQGTEDDLTLLAALLEAEAGSNDYEAVLAVGSVVMNRVNSSKYPNTIRGVIYQSGQFSPTWNGSLDRILKRGAASICYTAAKDAMNGKNNIGNCMSFRMLGTSHQGIIIGGNVFF